jgi:hypothetical protein
MVKIGGFVPEVGQEVLILNHLGIFRVTEIDSKARSATVTVLRSGALLEGIPWDRMTPWDEKTRCIIEKAAAENSLMTCRHFEDSMRVEFADADADYWRELLLKEDWDRLPLSPYREHLKGCDGCQTSLWQFFDIRYRVDYTRQPCFHVAYFSANVRDRCLENTHGMYSIATMDGRGHGIVIGKCPWCGVALPLGASEKHYTPKTN